MAAPSALDLATLVIAAYGAGLATYSHVAHRRTRLLVVEEPTWKIGRDPERSLHVGEDGQFTMDASMAFLVRVTNVGTRPVTLVAMVWHRREADDGLDCESLLIKDDWWDSAEFPKLMSDGETADFYIDIARVASDFRESPEGWFEVRDSTGRRWRARRDKSFREYVIAHPDDLRPTARVRDR